MVLHYIPHFWRQPIIIFAKSLLVSSIHNHPLATSLDIRKLPNGFNQCDDLWVLIYIKMKFYFMAGSLMQRPYKHSTFLLKCNYNLLVFSVKMAFVVYSVWIKCACSMYAYYEETMHAECMRFHKFDVHVCHDP